MDLVNTIQKVFVFFFNAYSLFKVIFGLLSSKNFATIAT